MTRVLSTMSISPGRVNPARGRRMSVTLKHTQRQRNPMAAPHFVKRVQRHDIRSYTPTTSPGEAVDVAAEVRRDRAMAAVRRERAVRREQEMAVVRRAMAPVRRGQAMAAARPERPMAARQEQALLGGDSR
jgi:hypothetical protein